MKSTNKTDTPLIKRNIVCLLLLALGALYCTMPLFIHHGLPYMDDMSFHVFQADQFNRGIEGGFIYPRWMLDFNKGYGSPNFIFYSPLSYYLVSGITIITHSLVTSMIIAVWFSFFLSGVTMFIATKRMFGGTGSLLTAIIYQILPYHLFDIYIRGAFAELFAFMWFPLIIMFLYRTIESRNSSAMAGLSVSYAGLICTHLVSGYMFTFVIGAYLIYNFFLLKEKKRIIRPFISMACGLGLSSVYLIPAILERKFVHIEYLVNCPICDYKNNFLVMWDKFQTELQSFYIPLHTIVFLEAILFLFTVMFIHKNKQVLLHRPQQKFYMLLFLIALFLTIPLSKPLWDLVPGFPFLQFPWRWVSMMEVALCFLLGSIFYQHNASKIMSSRQKRTVIYLVIILFAASLGLIFKSTPISSNIEIIRLNIVEYTPIWATNTEEILSAERYDKVSVISGSVVSKIKEWKSEERVIDTEVSEPALLRISTFFYPGWEATIDGKKTPIKIEKETGAILVDVPDGNHVVELKFEDTPIRYYSKIISMVSLTIIFIMAIFVKTIELRRTKT